MGKTYSCTFPNCNSVFGKAYELKKHKATHDDPNSVYYCSQCSFFTLQKKNLDIHFAIHTGEKIHHCPHMVSSIGSAGSPASEERCEYRTNDPAALTRHRKKVHDYLPPPNRSRRAKAAAASPRKPCKPRQKQVGKVSRRRRPFQRPVQVSSREPADASHMANFGSGGAGYTFAPTESPENPFPFLWQGDVAAYGQWMGTNPSGVSGWDPSISSSTALVVPDEGIDLTTLYDPSLHCDWMAKYEMGYSMPGTGLSHLPESLRAPPLPALASLDVQTGREGCLCPEWMVEAGIEGWDQSVLEAHKEVYVLDA